LFCNKYFIPRICPKNIQGYVFNIHILLVVLMNQCN